jgi:hypothetical protein
MKTPTFMINHYKNLANIGGDALDFLTEAQTVYIDMARGGAGHEIIGTKETTRTENYPNYPDTFFQEVCDELDWVWRKE